MAELRLRFEHSQAVARCPKQIEHPIQMAFETPTDQTSLAKIVLPLREKYPQLTGYHALYDPLEALAARIYLINKAEKSLDLQYYIWDNDKIGALSATCHYSCGRSWRESPLIGR